MHPNVSVSRRRSIRPVHRSELPPSVPPNMLFSAALIGTMTLAASAAESLGYFRVAARATNSHAIQTGPRDHWITVDGARATDLDCWLYDSSKQLVDSDTDATDYCVLSVVGSGVYRLVVRNQGGVASTYTVRKLERLR
jgi:hypothetical protein